MENISEEQVFDSSLKNTAQTKRKNIIELIDELAPPEIQFKGDLKRLYDEDRLKSKGFTPSAR